MADATWAECREKLQRGLRVSGVLEHRHAI